MSNVNVQVREEGDRILFLHRLAPGPCDRSYGIHVARMAGMPGAVLRRSEEILAGLERGGADSPANLGRPVEAPQMDLFGQPPPEATRLLQELRELDLDRTTPLQALELLSRWRLEADSAAEGAS